jgi:hypothetical protein
MMKGILTAGVFLFSSGLLFGQQASPDSTAVKKTGYVSRDFHAPKAEAVTSEVKTGTLVSEEAVVTLVCNTEGMSANQIMLREISTADFEISQINNAGNNATYTARLNTLQQYRTQRIITLVDAMTHADFVLLNREEQLFFIEECKALQSPKAAEYFDVFKANYTH